MDNSNSIKIVTRLDKIIKVSTFILISGYLIFFILKLYFSSTVATMEQFKTVETMAWILSGLYFISLLVVPASLVLKSRHTSLHSRNDIILVILIIIPIIFLVI